jgi:hypothetical protein
MIYGVIFNIGYCACGCKERLPIRNTQGRLSIFKRGHNGKLKNRNISGHKFMRGENSGDNHYNWKG